MTEGRYADKGNGFVQAKGCLIEKGSYVGAFALCSQTCHPQQKRVAFSYPQILHGSQVVLCCLACMRSTGGFIHAATMWKWMNQVEDVFIRKSLIDEVKVCVY